MFTVVEQWRHGEKDVDVFVPAEKVPLVKDKLEKSQLQYSVIIDNIQEAINNENPSLSEDELELAGRKGKCHYPTAA